MSKTNKITLEAFQFDGAARLPQYVEILRNEPYVKYGETNNLYSSFQVFFQNVPVHHLHPSIVECRFRGRCILEEFPCKHLDSIEWLD